MNLHNLLKEIYYLVNKVGFTAEYVESLPPAERMLFWNYYLEEKENERKQESGVSNYDVLSPDLPKSIHNMRT
jgi:hypothetical protein